MDKQSKKYDIKDKKVIVDLFVLWLALTALSCAAINLHILMKKIENAQTATYCTILSYPTTIYSGVNNVNLTVFAESVTSVLPLINAPFSCYAV